MKVSRRSAALPLVVPALLVINLRFIAQIAHTYGYRTASPAEQAFVLNVLGMSTATKRLRGAFVSSMNYLALEMAVKSSLVRLDSSAVVQLITKLTHLIGWRLAKRRAAQLVPLAGAVAGCSMSYTFTRDTLIAARMMYRKRRLIESCLQAASAAAG